MGLWVRRRENKSHENSCTHSDGEIVPRQWRHTGIFFKWVPRPTGSLSEATFASWLVVITGISAFYGQLSRLRELPQ